MKSKFQKMKSASLAAGALALAFGAIGAGTASAASQPTVISSETAASGAATYWTAARLKSAKPMAVKFSGQLGKATSALSPTASSLVVPGAGPSVTLSADAARQLYTPDPAASGGGGVSPSLVGTGGLPYTSNRLYPVADTYKAYPYAVVGKLFFVGPGGGNYVCSASVIRYRVIATAGHCVSDGNGHFYSKWLFIPAFNNGSAPYLSWNWSLATTTNNWFRGGGGVPNIQDDALIVLADQPYLGVTRRIGEITGYLGYQFNARLPTHITQLGYPCNLDSCLDPIANYAQLYASGTNNYQWGTSSFGGASGGPEIQDFGVAASGTPARILGGNILVSVTSWTFTNSAIAVDGGSILGSPGQFGGGTFGDLINSVCAGARNC